MVGVLLVVVAVDVSSRLLQEIAGDDVSVKIYFRAAVVRGAAVVSVGFCVDGLVKFNIEVTVTARVVAGNIAHDENTGVVADTSAVAVSVVVAMLVGKVVWVELSVISGLGAEVAAFSTPVVVSHDTASSRGCLAKPLQSLAWHDMSLAEDTHGTRTAINPSPWSLGVSIAIDVLALCASSAKGLL